MKLHELTAPYGAGKTRKRVGRGDGSGRGKTSGRGQKGQKARTGGNIQPWFEGGQNKLIKSLPYKRGVGFTNSLFTTRYDTVDLDRLSELDTDEITPTLLHDLGWAQHADRPLKVLGSGELTRPMNISAHAFTAGAMQKIQAAGGTATELEHADTENRRLRRQKREEAAVEAAAKAAADAEAAANAPVQEATPAPTSKKGQQAATGKKEQASPKKEQNAAPDKPKKARPTPAAETQVTATPAAAEVEAPAVEASAAEVPTMAAAEVEAPAVVAEVPTVAVAEVEAPAVAATATEAVAEVEAPAAEAAAAEAAAEVEAPAVAAEVPTMAADLDPDVASFIQAGPAAELSSTSGAAAMPKLTGGLFISQIRVDGPNGKDDEFIELYNGTDNEVNLNGYQLYYRAASGKPSVRPTLHKWASDTIIPAGGHYLLTGNDYDCPATPDARMGEQGGGQMRLEGGGVGLLDASGGVVDSVVWGKHDGSNAVASDHPYLREGQLAPAPTSGKAHNIARQQDGSYQIVEGCDSVRSSSSK